MIKVYGVPGWGSTISELMLTLADIPYQFVDVSGFDHEGASRELLKTLNPLSQVPTLALENDEIMTETAAIALMVLDRRPDLAPPVGRAERQLFQRLLVWLVANVYPTFTFADYPERWAPDAPEQLKKNVIEYRKSLYIWLNSQLTAEPYASGASLEVDNDQITNIDTDVAYDAYLVGWYGTGVLNILAGGNASLTTITTSVIGANEDSEGTVNVLGGTWRLYDSGNNARPLNVGQSGTGTLNIKQKGHVDGGYLRLGSSTGGVGTVNVEGEDSVLTTELFEIGSYGTGSLNITDKGYVTSSIVAILGYQAGSNGQVVVEKGGEWLIKNNDSSIEFQIGNQGTGEATIREGGLVTAENTIIGGNATGIGTLNVQDQDSVITVRRLYNGYFGNSTVNISNNGLINNKEYSLVGVQDGSHGVVNVTDKGHWNFLGTGEAFRYIYIGDAGDGELNVSSEGKVDSGIITAGMKETGTGNITVKDKNSVITNLGTNLGYDGHGEMNISNQGLVVSNGGSSLGYGETGVGNVSITTGGMWEVNKNVYTTIGVAGVGNLNISDGGKFVSQNITFLGDKASGIGTLNLMDATSSFDTVGINVGNFGSGIVNVSNGATLNSTGYGFIGGNASGKGIVNISTDSLWNLKTSSTNAQLLQVGVLGTGELNITTGGIVKARDTQIALNDKSKGDVRVDGQNSLLETFNMYVGTSGTGTLTLTRLC